MWLYLLNHADEMTEVPAKMAQVKEIQTAFDAAKRINLSALELEELEKRRLYAMQEEENLAWARRDALKEGREIGLVEGLEKGLEQGLEKGLEQGLEKGLEQGLEKGLEQGLEETRNSLKNLLQSKFGDLPADLVSAIDHLNSFEQISQAIVQAATAESVTDVETWLEQQQA